MQNFTDKKISTFYVLINFIIFNPKKNIFYVVITPYMSNVICV